MKKNKIVLAVLLALAAASVPASSLLDADFKVGEVYAFPNPARGAQKPTLHMELGMADSVTIEFVSLSGEKLGETTLTGTPQMINDGKGAEYAYEYTWDTSSLGSGVYVAAVTAHKAGFRDLAVVQKLAVLK